MRKTDASAGLERWRHAADVSLVVLGAGFLVWLVYRGFRVGDLPNADFFDFYFGAIAVRDGQDLYRVNDGGYIYPPLLAVVLRPLTYLQPSTAAHVWTIVLAALLSITAWVTAVEVRQRLGLGSSRVRTLALASGAMVLLGLTWKSEFQWGNSNLLVLLPVVLALRWVGRRPMLCGAALALAVSVKYLPVVLLPYLVLRRRWAEAGAFVGAMVLLLLAPALVLGWEKNVEYLGVAFRGLPEMAGIAERGRGANIHDVTSGFSLSVTSSLARWAERLGFRREYGVWATVAIAGAGAALGAWMYRARGVQLWIGRGGEREDSEPQGRALVLVEWGTLFAMAMLFSPQTTHRHLNMLMPLVACAVALAVACRGWKRWTLVASLALATLGATAIPGVAGWREATERWNQGGGAAACVAVLVFVTLWVSVGWARERQDGQASHTADTT